MKALVKLAAVSAAIALVLPLGGCAAGVDLKKVGESCRAPGDHTWVSPVDARLDSDYIVWEAVNVDYDSTNDPSVSCVLAELNTPSDIIANVRATKTVGLEQSASWPGYNLVWQGISVGNDLKGFISISVEKSAN